MQYKALTTGIWALLTKYCENLLRPKSSGPQLCGFQVDNWKWNCYLCLLISAAILSSWSTNQNEAKCVSWKMLEFKWNMVIKWQAPEKHSWATLCVFMFYLFEYVLYDTSEYLTYTMVTSIMIAGPFPRCWQTFSSTVGEEVSISVASPHNGCLVTQVTAPSWHANPSATKAPLVSPDHNSTGHRMPPLWHHRHKGQPPHRPG